MSSSMMQAVGIGAVLTASLGFVEIGKEVKRDIDLNAQRIGDAPVAGLGEYAPEACAGGTCECFAAGTLVATELGDRPIETLRVGDEVWALDVETGELTLKPILRRYVTPQQPVVHVELFSDRAGNEQLTVTPWHPFWVEDEGWVGALELGDDPIRSADAMVYAAAGGEAGELTVYNLEVADFHSYFVGRSRALVHNGRETRGPRRDGSDEGADSPAGGGSDDAGADECVQHMLGTPADDDDERMVRGNSTVPPFQYKTKTGKRHKDRPEPQSCNQPLGQGVAEDVCSGLVAGCLAKAKDDDAKTECLRQGACVYDFLAKHPTSSYFASASRRDSLHKQCSDGGVDVEMCYATGNVPGGSASGDAAFEKACRDRKSPDTGRKIGELAGEIAELDSRIMNEQDDAVRAHLVRLRRAAAVRKEKLEELAELQAEDDLDEDQQKRKKKLEQEELVNLSQELGEAAALARMEKENYTCVRGVSGRDEFDVICHKQGAGGQREVVIIEAKGGSSTLQPRWGSDDYHDKRVQQGTPAYLDTILAAMRGRGGRGRHYEGQGGDVMSDAGLLDLIESSEPTYMHVSASASCVVKAEVFETDRQRRALRCSQKGECCGDLDPALAQASDD